MIAERVSAQKQAGGPAFSSFTLLLPVEQYAQIAQQRLGDGSNVTVLQFMLASNPFLADVQPWFRCEGAGAGATDRMVLYPKTSQVVAGLVPMEFTPMPVEQRGINYIVNCLASCGGVICRYPFAMIYADGL